MASNSISTNEILVVVGIGAYLWYAHKQGWFPFGNNGPFNMGNSSQQQPSPTNVMSIPPPNNTQPFSQSNQIDLGSGFHMPVPPGNGYIDGQTGREIFATGPNSPFTSTVANDPSATDYGIYTQYLNGLRNEYQSQQQQQAAVVGQQQEGIGGDITTLPQPPTVGIVPYGFGGPVTPGMNPMPPPPGFMGPRPMMFYPPMMPPPRFYGRGYYNDNNSGINVGPIHIGADGIRIGDLLNMGLDGTNLSTGSGINIGSDSGDLSGQPLNGLDINNMLGNIGFNNFQQFTNGQNNLSQSINDMVNSELARFGLHSNYAKSYATSTTGDINDNNTTPLINQQPQLPAGLNPNDPDFQQKLRAYIIQLEQYLIKNLPINNPLNPVNTPFNNKHPLHPLNKRRNHRGGRYHHYKRKRLINPNLIT